MSKENIYDRDTLIKVAKMYYLQELSQEQISSQIHVSRPTVSRMLKSAEKEGIVQIRIDEVSSFGMELSKSICEKFGLDKTIVAPTGTSLSETKNNVGAAAAVYLETAIPFDSLVGICWGTTLYRVIKQIRPSKHLKADVIQLVGGIGSKTTDTDGNTTSLTLAQKLNGDNYVLQAPLLVQSKLLKDLLTSEPHIRNHFNRMMDCKIAIAGIGSIDPEFSAHYRSGYITLEEIDRLKAEKAVGDICGTYFDVEGKICPSTLSDRTIAITLSDLVKIPNVVGIAAGEEKTQCILGALRGKYLNTLITDEITAERILDA